MGQIDETGQNEVRNQQRKINFVAFIVGKIAWVDKTAGRVNFKNCIKIAMWHPT